MQNKKIKEGQRTGRQGVITTAGAIINSFPQSSSSSGTTTTTTSSSPTTGESSPLTVAELWKIVEKEKEKRRLKILHQYPHLQQHQSHHSHSGYAPQFPLLDFYGLDMNQHSHPFGLHVLGNSYGIPVYEASSGSISGSSGSSYAPSSDSSSSISAAGIKMILKYIKAAAAAASSNQGGFQPYGISSGSGGHHGNLYSDPGMVIGSYGSGNPFDAPKHVHSYADGHKHHHIGLPFHPTNSRPQSVVVTEIIPGGHYGHAHYNKFTAFLPSTQTSHQATYIVTHTQPAKEIVTTFYATYKGHSTGSGQTTTVTKTVTSGTSNTVSPTTTQSPLAFTQNGNTLLLNPPIARTNLVRKPERTNARGAANKINKVVKEIIVHNKNDKSRMLNFPRGHANLYSAINLESSANIIDVPIINGESTITL